MAISYQSLHSSMVSVGKVAWYIVCVLHRNSLCCVSACQSRESYKIFCADNLPLIKQMAKNVNVFCGAIPICVTVGLNDSRFLAM